MDDAEIDEIPDDLEDDIEEEELEEEDDKSDISIDIEVEKKQEQFTNKQIVKNNTRTQDRLTTFEYATLVSIRASQIIQNGGNSYASNAKSYDSPKTLAEKELNEGKYPLNILREIKDGIYEKI
jgi:DNA-directed RNA polymerase subunit K/omega